MTAREFKELYGMSVTEAKRKRKELFEKKHQDAIFTTYTVLEDEYESVGFGMYVPTGKKVEKVYTTKVEREEIVKEWKYINSILNPYEKEIKERNKRKEYEKELKELEERVKYLKTWLAEN